MDIHHWPISGGHIQQHEKTHDDEFCLHLDHSAQALHQCLRASASIFKYTKQTFSYQTNLVEDIPTSGMVDKHIFVANMRLYYDSTAWNAV